MWCALCAPGIRSRSGVLEASTVVVLDSSRARRPDAFKDAAAYYGTAQHELAHWTGHPSQLDRSTLTESYLVEAT